jgi:hypothetical protein
MLTCPTLKKGPIAIARIEEQAKGYGAHLGTVRLIAYARLPHPIKHANVTDQRAEYYVHRYTSVSDMAAQFGSMVITTLGSCTSLAPAAPCIEHSRVVASGRRQASIGHALCRAHAVRSAGIEIGSQPVLAAPWDWAHGNRGGSSLALQPETGRAVSEPDRTSMQPAPAVACLGAEAYGLTRAPPEPALL